MRGVCDAHFPDFRILEAAIRVPDDDTHTAHGRTVHHEGLDEAIVYIYN